MRRSNRKYRKFSRRRIVLYLLLLAFVTVRTVCFAAANFYRTRRQDPQAGIYKVVKVIDCRSFVLGETSESGEKFTVRLLGIQTVEESDRGLNSMAFALSKRLVGQGSDAVLRLDRRRFDGDGINLGHLYVFERLISCELVRAGLVRLDTRPGDSSEIVRLLKKAEQEARLARVGIWRAGPGS